MSVCLKNGHCQNRLHPGAVEMGGGGAFMVHMVDKGENNSELIAGPILNFYCIAPGFYLGPLLNFNSRWSETVSLTSLIYGANAGFAMPSEGAATPYFGMSIGRISTSFKQDNPFGAEISDEAGGIYMPIYAGCKFQVGRSFFLNLQPTFTYTTMDSQSEQTFSLQISFTGLIGG